jgi:hypothetical protein
MIEQGQPRAAAHGHEPQEANVRGVCLTAAILAGVVVASFLLMFGLLNLFSAATRSAPASQFDTPDPQSLREQRLQSLRGREHALLHQYQWVDPAAGIARIPIERAIEIVARRGLSSTEAGDQSPPTGNVQP